MLDELPFSGKGTSHFNLIIMGRFHVGMVVRTNYGTGPYKITKVTEGCTCPRFVDSINLGDEAPNSAEHCHLTCTDIQGKGPFWLNGYDDNGNSVWSTDRIIVCAEETTLLTMCL